MYLVCEPKVLYIEFALAKKGEEEKENQDPIFRKFKEDQKYPAGYTDHRVPENHRGFDFFKVDIA